MADEKVTGIHEYTASITSAAREFGVAYQTLKARVDESGLEPAGAFRGATVYRIADLAAALYAADVPNAPDDFDDLPPTERRAWFESEKLRLEVERELAGLVTAADAAREKDRAARAMLNYLEQIERDAIEHAGLDANAREVIAKRMEPARRTLREYIIPRIGDDDQ